MFALFLHPQREPSGGALDFCCITPDLKEETVTPIAQQWAMLNPHYRLTPLAATAIRVVEMGLSYGLNRTYHIANFTIDDDGVRWHRFSDTELFRDAIRSRHIEPVRILTTAPHRRTI